MYIITELQFQQLSNYYPNYKIINDIRKQNHKVIKAKETIDNVYQMINSGDFFMEDFEPELSRLLDIKKVSSNKLQTLQNKLAAICIELDCCIFEKFTKEMYTELRKRLREFSTIIL